MKVEGNCPALHLVAPHVSRKLSTIIMNAMAPDPLDRYDSAMALYGAIQSYYRSLFSENGRKKSIVDRLLGTFKKSRGELSGSKDSSDQSKQRAALRDTESLSVIPFQAGLRSH